MGCRDDGHATDFVPRGVDLAALGGPGGASPSTFVLAAEARAPLTEHPQPVRVVHRSNTERHPGMTPFPGRLRWPATRSPEAGLTVDARCGTPGTGDAAPLDWSASSGTRTSPATFYAGTSSQGRRPPCSTVPLSRTARLDWPVAAFLLDSIRDLRQGVQLRFPGAQPGRGWTTDHYG